MSNPFLTQRNLIDPRIINSSYTPLQECPQPKIQNFLHDPKNNYISHIVIYVFLGITLILAIAALVVANRSAPPVFSHTILQAPLNSSSHVDPTFFQSVAFPQSSFVISNMLSPSPFWVIGILKDWTPFVSINALFDDEFQLIRSNDSSSALGIVSQPHSIDIHAIVHSSTISLQITSDGWAFSNAMLFFSNNNHIIPKFHLNTMQQNIHYAVYISDMDTRTFLRDTEIEGSVEITSGERLLVEGLIETGTYDEDDVFELTMRQNYIDDGITYALYVMEDKEVVLRKTNVVGTLRTDALILLDESPEGNCERGRIAYDVEQFCVCVEEDTWNCIPFL